MTTSRICIDKARLRRSVAVSLCIVSTSLAILGCDTTSEKSADTPRPTKLCDDIPYQWVVDVTTAGEVRTRSISGRIGVTRDDPRGLCTVADADQPDKSILLISTEITFDLGEQGLNKTIPKALKAGRGIPTVTKSGVGIAYPDPYPAGEYTAAWACDATTVQISLRDPKKIETVQERLRIFAERVAGLMTCQRPL